MATPSFELPHFPPEKRERTCGFSITNNLPLLRIVEGEGGESLNGPGLCFVFGLGDGGGGKGREMGGP